MMSQSIVQRAWDLIAACSKLDDPIFAMQADGWSLSVKRPSKVSSVPVPPNFGLGDHVIIKPLEDCPGRVIGMELDHDGWTVIVRYFQNGEAKTLKTFGDEIEAVSPQNTVLQVVDDWRNGKPMTSDELLALQARRGG